MEKFIKETIKEAGKIILEGFHQELEISTKNNPHDLVTQYDQKVEDFIVGKIQEIYPEVGILAEESGTIKEADKFFIIDPIDGTKNFTRTIPISCVIISYVENERVVRGAVYDPYQDEFFYAERGKGATLNGKQIKVSKKNEIIRLTGSLAAIDHYFPGTKKKYDKKFHEVAKKLDISEYSLHCAGLNETYAACGRHDLAVLAGMAPWDMAGPSLILEEAGAQISEIEGGDYKWNSRSLVASSPEIHEKLIKALNG